MPNKLNKITEGYQRFREKYIIQDNTLLSSLALDGQRPQVMVVACCDSRVDPALLLQCDPGDLFVVRNVANIVPPYENDEAHHGTSAALEFGICYLNIEHLIILGHSQCAGIHALLNHQELKQDDFISNWTNLITVNETLRHDADACAKQALLSSYQNCLTFPWIKQRIQQDKLEIHLWFFEIQDGMIHAYYPNANIFSPLVE